MTKRVFVALLLAVACGGENAAQPPKIAIPSAAPSDAAAEIVRHAKTADPEGLTLAINSLGADDEHLRMVAEVALLEYVAKANGKKLTPRPNASDAELALVSWVRLSLGDASAWDDVVRLRATVMGLKRVTGATALDAKVLARLSLDDLARRPEAAELIVAALPDAIGASRGPLLDALARIGARALCSALGAVHKEAERAQTNDILERVRLLADPRAADALAAFADKATTHPHWRTIAAFRLAEIGDVRAASHLAWRLRQEPQTLYTDEYADLARDDTERVISARLLAELALALPMQRSGILADCETSLIDWIKSRPQPHANALRALTALQSKAIVSSLKTWADPKTPLPKPGAQPPFPSDIEIAQSALRYLGASKDPGALDILKKQIARAPAGLDWTMDGLMQGGIAMLGMSLRALTYGAADGFAELGDPKGYPFLAKVMDDPHVNEQARTEACTMAALVATDAQAGTWAAKLKSIAKKDAAGRVCYAQALERRSDPALAASLVDPMLVEKDPEVRHALSAAIGWAGVDAAAATKLLASFQAPGQLRYDAMVALLLGSSPADIPKVWDAWTAANGDDVFRQLFMRSHTITDVSWDKGALSRIAMNARVSAKHEVKGSPQDWMVHTLRSQLRAMEQDMGPHSMTLLRMRLRCMQDARSPYETVRHNAIAILGVLGERGVLSALADDATVGAAAKQELGLP